MAGSQNGLVDLLESEKPSTNQKPEKDKVAFFQLIASMYIKYIQILRKLETCYDQIVHPQKRIVLRNVLDGVLGRLLELKQEMVDLECLEYHFFDDILSDLKLTPNDVEMPIPKYFVLEQEKTLRSRQDLMARVLERIGQSDPAKLSSESGMTVEEAVRLIRVHERARQGRLRAKFMREIRLRELKSRMRAAREAPEISEHDAAVRIQKVHSDWTETSIFGPKFRPNQKHLSQSTPPAQFLTSQKSAAQVAHAKAQEERRATQAAHRQEFEQALVSIRNQLMETEGPDMQETMQAQIRQWFIECRDATGKFPDYPEGEQGSAELFKQKSLADLENEINKKDDNKESRLGEASVGSGGGREGARKGGGKGAKKSGGAAKGGKRGKGDDDGDEGLKLKESKFTADIGKASQEYERIWRHRDETDNFQQRFDPELIKEEKRIEVEREVRVQVDELMRQELRGLKMAIDKEKVRKKIKKSGKKKKKTKKGKKSAGKKGRKGKKEKDLTPEATIESLYEELVSNGIIKKVPRVLISDYEGEYNYLGTTLKQANIEPMPSLADVRRTVTELACLPLGSEVVHRSAPLVKSLLLAGPGGVGKRMLVDAVCTETGANLIDLSAENLAGRYPGKDGLRRLMHLVFKVGKALQPSVLFIEDCDMMFRKKAPKGEAPDPKRLKKELPKAMKNIKAEDRILLIGTSRTPWEAEQKPFCALYQRILLIPRPDYASRHLVWRRALARHGGPGGQLLDISALAKATDGNTIGHIKLCCEEVLTPRRLAALQHRPLTTQEFIPAIARREFVHSDEEEAFKRWYERTPMGRRRAKAMAAEAEAAQLGGGGGGGGSGKAGKGQAGKGKGKQKGKRKGKKKGKKAK
uniref:ATPase_AAA_core domain-containing protein n=1 Tax=Macrostomum lignano TaxID=282301 RepID=A0A1I8J6F6_9PLAT